MDDILPDLPQVNINLDELRNSYGEWDFPDGTNNAVTGMTPPDVDGYTVWFRQRGSVMIAMFREGDRVRYSNGFDEPELGTVTSAGPTVVFVRYDKNPHAANGTATSPEDLQMVKAAS